MKNQLRPRIVQKRGLLITSVVFLLFIMSTVFYFQFGEIDSAKAVSNGDYRSAGSGNWNNTGSWETYDGTNWVAAASTPATANGSIAIQNGHTISVTANVTADEVVVDAGGILSVASGKTLTIANGIATDLMVKGSLTINGTLTQNGSSSLVLSGGTATLASGGSHSISANATDSITKGGRYIRNDASMTKSANIWVIDSGSVFQQNINGDNLPLATWKNYSSCEVSGVTTTKPGDLDQTFYHFTWNSPNQTSSENLQGKLTTITGDFNFISSGTGLVRLGQSETYTMTVGGNLNVQGGSLFASTKSTGCTINITGNYDQTGGTFGGTDASLAGEKAAGVPTINVSGNFSLSAGTFDMTQNTATGAGDGISTLNLSGNFTQTGGTITETATTAATYGYGKITFAKTGTQTFSKTAGTLSNTIHFTVNNGAVLDMGTSSVTGNGSFTLASGAGLNIASTEGITQSGATGNVQVTGTRSYSTGAEYTYNGTSAQVTGNALPATVSKLTVSNNNGIVLTNSTSVSTSLTLTSGNITTSNDTLTLGTSTSVLGTLSRTSGKVVGTFQRWIAASATNDILFPIGTSVDYKGANFSFTSAPSAGGTLTVNFTPANLSTNGSNFLDSPDSIQTLGNGYWAASAASGLSGGTFNADLTATNMFGVTNYTSLHLVMRANAGAAWGKQGTHVAATGSNAIPVVRRSGMTTLGHFGVGSPSSGNILPIQLMFFNAKLNNNHVDLTWATASELNSDFFTIERSADGMLFKEVLIKQAAGNSTVILNYSAVDENPLPGNSYYRLKETDNNGLFTYSDVKLITNSINPEGASIAAVSAAPNPFYDGCTITFTLKSAGQVNFQLSNSSGQIIFQHLNTFGEGLNQYEFVDELGLTSGVYFATLVFNNEKATIKIIKK